jgi:uncharacterized membrane protein
VSAATLRRVAVATALAGLAIAGYLAITSLTDTAPVCATGGCETVQESDYAHIAGIPVAVLGVAGWLTLLVLALLPGERALTAAAVVALAAAVFGVYLIALQLVVIEAICQWCVVNDLLALVAAAVAFARLARSGGPVTA